MDGNIWRRDKWYYIYEHLNRSNIEFQLEIAFIREWKRLKGTYENDIKRDDPS